MRHAGKTLAENLEDLPGLVADQQVIVPLEQPIKRTGHLQILYGNIAPEGCVGKITGKEGLAYEGIARCFNKEEDMLDALAEDPNSFKVSFPNYRGCNGQGVWLLRQQLLNAMSSIADQLEAQKQNGGSRPLWCRDSSHDSTTLCLS